jgi:hypothetical protein
MAVAALKLEFRNRLNGTIVLIPAMSPGHSEIMSRGVPI